MTAPGFLTSTGGGAATFALAVLDCAGVVVQFGEDGAGAGRGRVEEGEEGRELEGSRTGDQEERWAEAIGTMEARRHGCGEVVIE